MTNVAGHPEPPKLSLTTPSLPAADPLVEALSAARRHAAETENWSLVSLLTQQLAAIAPKPALTLVRKPAKT